ncbi:MAG: P1 family peptidase [Alphaproteobacteria bacterium]
MKTGPLNLITDVAGFKVGNAQDEKLQSGVTVLIGDDPFVAAVDIRGGAPGSRETALLDPSCTIQHVHAITLSGGSAWGLNAADGVMDFLKQAGKGLKWQDAVIPIVPTSILFDLLNGGDKDWDKNPYAALGKQAASNAADKFQLGSVGAGTGAKAGNIKGGLGSASFHYKDHFMVGALVAANPIGSVLMPSSNVFWAWAFEQNNEFGGIRPDPNKQHYGLDYPFQFANGVEINAPDTNQAAIQNTTIAIIATDLALTKSEATRIAMAAQDGLARAIRPVHTPLDGDSVYVVSSGKVAMKDAVSDMARLSMLAADCLARAIARGVFEATSPDNFMGGKYMGYQQKYL